MARVLLVDDEASLRHMLGILLERAGHEVLAVGGVLEALARIGSEAPFDAVITDLMMPDGSGMQILEAALNRDESTQVLMITAYATTEQAVEAMRKGAYDYVRKPFKNDELLAALDKALEKQAIVEEVRTLRAQVASGASRSLIGESPAMRELRAMLARVASSLTNVLITGESGTGKEMVARALHFGGARAERAYVVINCGALPEALMESEIFGHEKGAFTGATSAKEGLFRAAHRGTLFLDEIGELPLSLQVKLLRVLQERRIRPVGAHRELPVDVRLVAATNRDLEAEVRAGRFREDLFYRLNVLRLHIPALRERREDIAPLAEHFLRKHGGGGSKPPSLSVEALAWLREQPWPGNVRQLENVIERALILSEGALIEREDLVGGAGPRAGTEPVIAEGFDLVAYLAEVERQMLLRALEQAGGIRTKAAELLGMSFRSYRYRLSKLLGDEEA
ncbi:MAG: sigma-54 dependent transcriptional regulator [Myxococcales bacterium]|nr:sigma-54 dependent transcriptional regulator [Myxococcales bacterium]